MNYPLLHLNPIFAEHVSSLASTLVYATLPPILWLLLCLWLNRKHPRRKGFLSMAFFVGALAVIPALPIQKFVYILFHTPTILTVLWAATEELLKFAAFMFIAYRGSKFNGPRDYALTAVTAALGFAGLENALYFFQSVLAHNASDIALYGSMRFLGSNLLHAITGSAMGLALGFAYFKSRRVKIVYGVIGITIATFVHTVFNLRVENASQETLFHAFEQLWVLAGLSAIFWILLRAMEQPSFIKNAWATSIARYEKSFFDLLKTLGVSVDGTAPLRDTLLEKKMIPGTAEYNTLYEVIMFLRKEYALRLRTQGIDEDNSHIAAESVVNSTVSPKLIAEIFNLLKKSA